MSKAWEQYVSEMYKKFGYIATWTPGVQLKLGDFGIIKDKKFDRIANIGSLGITFQTRPDSSEESQKHTSTGNVSVIFKAAGKAPQVGSVLTEAEAGFTIEFKKSKSTVYEALGCTAPSIENQLEIGKKVIELYKKGDWNKDWVVITELVEAKSATVLISNSSNSKIEISVKGNISGATASIADVNAKLQVEFSRDMNTQLVSEKGLTPLFKARGIKSNGPVGPFENINRLGSLDFLDYATPNSLTGEEELLFEPILLDFSDDEI